MNPALANWQDAVDFLRKHGIDVHPEAYGFAGTLRDRNAGDVAITCGLDHLECEAEHGCISLSLNVGLGPRVARVFIRSSSEHGLTQIAAFPPEKLAPFA